MTLSTEKKYTATVYTVFLAILFLINIFVILNLFQVLPTVTRNVSASTTIQMSPIVIAMLVIYAAFWISQFFLGKKTGLRPIGYAGAAIMAVVAIYDIVVSLIPVYYYLMESLGSSASVVFSAISIFVGLIGITGLLLFMLGTKMPMTLKILTPGYPLLGLILNSLVLPLLVNTVGFEYMSACIINSVILILYIVLLFIMLLVWKKESAAAETAA